MKLISFERKGISLIEIIIVISVLALLIGLASTSFIPRQGRTAQTTSISTFLTDLRAQQIKAMTGDTEGRGIKSAYGIHFEEESYTLFHGDTYSFIDSSNFVVNLEDGTTISPTTFPDSQIVFEKDTGEVVGFVSGSNTITIRNSINNEEKIITINKYGAATDIN